MIKVYGSPDKTSANTLKILVTLAESGAEFEHVAVDLMKGEHKKPDFLAINPHGKVPALVDDDIKLAETNAILWYIARRFPASLLPTSLLPTGADVALREARVVQFLDMVSMHIYGPSYDYYLHTVGNEPEKRDPAIAEKAKSNIDRALAVIENALGTREYLAGEFSIADLSAAATLSGLKKRNAAYENFGQATTEWLKRVLARPSWEKALT